MPASYQSASASARCLSADLALTKLMDELANHHHTRGMLRLAIRHVYPDKVDELREWLRIVNGPRRAEALATLIDETCSHEQAVLIEGKDGPVVVYVMEVADADQSRRAAERSAHQIDADHRQVMQSALGDAVQREVLLDLRP